MVSFLTLFLGLWVGAQTVELDVSGPVAEVEARLDGRTVATLTAAPWSFEIDLGPVLSPHSLIVVARDADGRELDHTEQWINLTQRTSAAAMAFETAPPGEPAAGWPRAVSLVWESTGRLAPETVEVFFDGQPLPVTDPRRIPLPSYEPGTFHFVTAVVSFSDDPAAGAEAVTRLGAGFGGVYGEEVESRLTAVAVELEKGARSTSEREVHSWFRDRGEPLRVHAVEKGTAEVILVRDPSAQKEFQRLAKLIAEEAKSANRRVSDQLRYSAWFGEEVRLSFVAPAADPSFAELTSEMFLKSPRLASRDGGFLWLTQQQPAMRWPLRLADAVAAAGMEVYAGQRRRAVILLLADEPGGDHSRQPAAAVRAYLRQLRVPLFVWSFTSPEPHPEWGEVRYVGLPPKPRKVPDRFRDAIREVRRNLESQRVVWLQGHHLPQAVELASEARGIRLAGL